MLINNLIKKLKELEIEYGDMEVGVYKNAFNYFLLIGTKRILMAKREHNCNIGYEASDLWTG